GFGAPKKQGTAGVHGSPLGAEEIASTRQTLGWPHPPFEVPEPVVNAWRIAGRRGAAERASWQERWAKVDPKLRQSFEHPAAAHKEALQQAINEAKRKAAAETAKKATRQWSEFTLDHLVPVLPGLIGGSADLTGSNNTKTKSQVVIRKGDFSGTYIHYGIREHGRAAAMNGLALYGGLIPDGGTFLVLYHACRPATRVSALLRQRADYLVTHDPIGLGEDGPTHQPIEHLASLGAMPNLNVLRPADGVETAECWEIAVRPDDTPSILALTRQAVPNLRTTHTDENLSAKGAYVLRETNGKRDVTLLATGSEVGLAVEAAEALASQGVAAAVVSMPCFELFRQQPESYRRAVLGEAP